MKITRQIAADKIADYLHGKVSQAELVDWAELAMMDADFYEAETEVLSESLAASDWRMLLNSDCAGRTARSFFVRSGPPRGTIVKELKP